MISGSGKVAAATTPSLEGQAAVLAESSNVVTAGERREAHPLLVNNEHFLVMPGRYGAGESSNGFSYLLLYSNEDRYRALVDTRRTLAIFGVLGIFIHCGNLRKLQRRLGGATSRERSKRSRTTSAATSQVRSTG